MGSLSIYLTLISFLSFALGPFDLCHDLCNFGPSSEPPTLLFISASSFLLNFTIASSLLKTFQSRIIASTFWRLSVWVSLILVMTTVFRSVPVQAFSSGQEHFTFRVLIFLISLLTAPAKLLYTCSTWNVDANILKTEPFCGQNKQWRQQKTIFLWRHSCTWRQRLITVRLPFTTLYKFYCTSC